MQVRRSGWFSCSLLFLFVYSIVSPSRAFAADYHVGPQQEYATIGAVPWYKLAGGDTVYIHYQPAPYKEKFLISTRGTESKWFRVLGVPGPNGELPIISGDGATTSVNNHYKWTNPSDVQVLGVVQIAINSAAGEVPGYVEIANLQIQDGHPSKSFTAENGTKHNYSEFSACIHARSPQHLYVHDNIFRNCGLGLYTWTGGADNTVWWEAVAKDIRVSRNHFVGNGVSGSYLEHQSYVEADGALYEYNFYDAMNPQSAGS